MKFSFQIIDPINKLINTIEFDAIFYSLDWHPSDHISFIDNIKKRPLHPESPVKLKKNHKHLISFSKSKSFQIDSDTAQVYDTVIYAGPPPMKQRMWPRHCVQDSWGAELHKDLKVVQSHFVNQKRFLTNSVL